MKVGKKYYFDQDMDPLRQIKIDTNPNQRGIWFLVKMEIF